MTTTQEKKPVSEKVIYDAPCAEGVIMIGRRTVLGVSLGGLLALLTVAVGFGQYLHAEHARDESMAQVRMELTDVKAEVAALRVAVAELTARMPVSFPPPETAARITALEQWRSTVEERLGRIAGRNDK